MKLSDNGLNLIKLNEGWVPKIYKDSAGLDTIGYGHLLTAEDKKSGKYKAGISEVDGANLLRKDVSFAENAVNKHIKVQLTQGQFDALVDFTFNLGTAALASSKLLKKLNAGEYDSVPSEMLRWNKVRNPKTNQLEPVTGLTKRRERAIVLWNQK